MTLTELKFYVRIEFESIWTKNEVVIRLMEYDEGSDGNTASNVPATQTGSCQLILITALKQSFQQLD